MTFQAPSLNRANTFTMQRLLAAILAVTLASGCSAHTGGKIGTGVGLGLIGVGALFAAGVGPPGGETDPEDWAFVPITAGALILIPALVVLFNSSDDDVKPKPAPPISPSPTAAD